MTKEKNFFLLAVVGIVFVSAVFLHPSLSSVLLPFKRTIMWNGLSNKITSTKQIDGRDFWQFREFYYPGNFIFDPLKLKPSTYTDLLKSNNISFNKKTDYYPFLYFQSAKIKSLEGMTNKKVLTSLFGTNAFDKYSFLSRTLYVSKTDNAALLLFVQPIAEMKKTNAHYDYRGEYKDIVNKYSFWFVITEINLK